MKKMLRESKGLYYIKGGEIRIGAHNKLSGYCTELIGNCSGLSGNCSGLYGDCTGLSGDLDQCEITQEDRIKGININDLKE